MLVKWPGVTAPGSVCDDYLIIEDFFPTILEMGGLTTYETVQQVDGQSFVPLLKGESTGSEERALFWHFPNNWGPTGPGIGASSTIRLGKWKLIYYHEDQRFELFDLEADIGEQHNLAAREPDQVNALAKELSDYLISVNAQMPLDKQSGQPVPLPGVKTKEL